MSGEKTLRIAYFGRTLPTLSETFVTREIHALRELGVEVIPFSLFKQDEKKVHEADAELLDEAVILFAPGNHLFWLAHLAFLFTHPLKYLKLFWKYVLAFNKSFSERKRVLGQFLMAPRAAQLVKGSGADHIHAHFANSPAGVAMMIKELTGLSFSFTTHSFDLFIENLLLEEKITAASFVATVTHYNVEHLRKTYAAATAADIHIIRCGIDPNLFTKQKSEPKQTPVILGVGRLIELKGFHLLIEAADILKQDGTDFHLEIIGEGPERESLENLIAEFDVGEYVYLLGAKTMNEVLKHYQDANIFVLPCVRRHYSDNLPVVLIEALAMGIPSISSPLAGIPELIENEVTGLLVESENSSQLALAIKRLLQDSDLCQRLSLNGRKRVKEEFTIKSNAIKIKNLFADVVKTGGD